MGRPEDQIWALHTLQPTLPNKKWKCRYCHKEFAGSATRVREHLYHQGNNISPCSLCNLSSECGEKGARSGEKELKGKVQKKEAKRTSNKRRRKSLSPSYPPSRDNVSDQVVNIPTSHTNIQETTDDLLIKFCMSNNLPLDRIKDPILVSLLTRVAQYGVPSCLHRNDKLVIEKSVWNWEFEVKEYMVLVKESWTTTGCTLTRYNFNLENDNIIYGFYSPKGFIFVQGPRADCDNNDHLRDTLKNNVLNLPFDDVTHCIVHVNYHACELAYQPAAFSDPSDGPVCFRHVMQEAWDKICKKSRWVEKIILASEKVYKILSHPDASTARVEVVYKKHVDGMAMSSFAHLKSIMHLKDKKILLLGDADRSEEIWCYVEDTINDKDFWEDGKELIEALNPVLEAVKLVDTLCPVSPYLPLALDRATRTIKSCCHRDPDKYQEIWDCFQEYDPYREYHNLEAIFFSPIYIISVGGRNTLITRILHRNPELEEELHRYKSDSPFNKVDQLLLLKDHPVKLWEEYGDEFPKLKAHAIKVLNAAGSCMCNQIKKKLEQIQGCDNILMRLNYKMMEEFQKLGNSIYKPPPDLPYWAAKERSIRFEEESDIGSGEESDIRADEAVPLGVVEAITNAECELPNGLQPKIATPYGLVGSTETATYPQPLYSTSFTGASTLLNPQDNYQDLKGSTLIKHPSQMS